MIVLMQKIGPLYAHIMANLCETIHNHMPYLGGTIGNYCIANILAAHSHSQKSLDRTFCQGALC